MKRLVVILIAAISLFYSPIQASLIPVHACAGIHKQTVVYITRTGSKFHKSDCSYLRKSKIQTTRKEAISNGYTACSRCNP